MSRPDAVSGSPGIVRAMCKNMIPYATFSGVDRRTHVEVGSQPRATRTADTVKPPARIEMAATSPGSSLVTAGSVRQ